MRFINKDKLMIFFRRAMRELVLSISILIMVFMIFGILLLFSSMK